MAHKITYPIFVSISNALSYLPVLIHSLSVHSFSYLPSIKPSLYFICLQLIFLIPLRQVAIEAAQNYCLHAVLVSLIQWFIYAIIQLIFVYLQQQCLISVSILQSFYFFFLSTQYFQLLTISSLFCSFDPDLIKNLVLQSTFSKYACSLIFLSTHGHLQLPTLFFYEFQTPKCSFHFQQSQYPILPYQFEGNFSFELPPTSESIEGYPQLGLSFSLLFLFFDKFALRLQIPMILMNYCLRSFFNYLIIFIFADTSFALLILMNYMHLSSFIFILLWQMLSYASIFSGQRYSSSFHEIVILLHFGVPYITLVFYRNYLNFDGTEFAYHFSGNSLIVGKHVDKDSQDIGSWEDNDVNSHTHDMVVADQNQSGCCNNCWEYEHNCFFDQMPHYSYYYLFFHHLVQSIHVVASNEESKHLFRIFVMYFYLCQQNFHDLKPDYSHIIVFSFQLLQLFQFLSKLIQFIIMILKQPLSELFNLDEEGFIICTGTNYRTVMKQGPKYSQSLETLCKIINTLGELSAASQGLKQVITNITRFSGTTQRIYIKTSGNQALGFVKSGQKNLFYRDIIGNIRELQPTCVLDIYVHESCQRTGYGKEIFQKLLKSENTIPEKLAYDRPSPKLISFLKKHYKLVNFVPQNNNYVIFNQFFTASNSNQIKESKYFIHNRKIESKQKQNSQTSVLQRTQLKPRDVSLQLHRQQKQKQIVDSLQIMKQQVERSKGRSTIAPMFGSEKQADRNYPGSNPPIDSNYQNFASLRAIQSNSKYALNMKLKDLSFRVPWATQQQDLKYNFRTTSNTYGNPYKK